VTVRRSRRRTPWRLMPRPRDRLYVLVIKRVRREMWRRGWPGA
jgi:hypothetical protein